MQPEIVTFPLCQLASGDRLLLQVYRFVGHQPGKKVYIQANLHGAEIAGNGVIFELIETLQGLDAEALWGEVWLLPVCNPQGVNQRSHHFTSGRYNPYDGRDWNRIFWDYEQVCRDLGEFAQSHQDLEPEDLKHAYRAKILECFEQYHRHCQGARGGSLAEIYRYRIQSLCLDADYLLDLHTSTNQAVDYLYCGQGRSASAQSFQAQFAIILDEYDGNALDEAFLKPWIALERELRHLGRPLQFDLESWTLELGSGMAMNRGSIRRGYQGILNYLAHKGVLKCPGYPLPPSPEPFPIVHKNQLKRYYAVAGGFIGQRAAVGQMVQVGDPLYTLITYNKSRTLPATITIQAQDAGLVFDHATSQSMNQGEYVLSIVSI
ncbi:MAG: succinylglutamate desuccinylase [Prochlorothrix sp.]|nr:succinylglutamate desuccinylase/aspartoacylase family protein [Prochlorothrix sp.]